jgi:serine/threonine protein kinase
MPLADGATFAGYTIVRMLGSGGMGEVYLAQHRRPPRRDALKVLPSSRYGIPTSSACTTAASSRARSGSRWTM